MIRFSVRRAAPLALAMLLCACSHNPRPTPIPAPQLPVQASIDSALALLDQGDEVGARAQVLALLKANPGDPQVRVLQESLEKDPVALLGPKSFSYVVRSGDTMLGISEKFLGTRLKFYQLARYNAIKIPAQLAAGTTLKIPGETPHALEPARAKSSSRASESDNKPSRPRSAAVSPPPAGPVRNLAIAQKLRSAGLADLNQGKVADAVTLLGRALSFDPGNPLIQRDLARAVRIERTVAAHR